MDNRTTYWLFDWGLALKKILVCLFVIFLAFLIIGMAYLNAMMELQMPWSSPLKQREPMKKQAPSATPRHTVPRSTPYGDQQAEYLLQDATV